MRGNTQHRELSSCKSVTNACYGTILQLYFVLLHYCSILYSEGWSLIDPGHQVHVSRSTSGPRL